MSVVPRPSHEAARRVHQQVRRAWIVLVTAALVFALLVSGVVSAWRVYRQHATQSEPATLEVISGNGALVRSKGSSDWRIVTDATTIHEGDSVSTALGTVVWLTMFDGSTVEVSEDTIVRIARMRASRYHDATKHFILEPERGTVYIGMAPHGEYDYVEFTTRAHDVELTMSDETGRDDAGAYLFEVVSNAEGSAGDNDSRTIRAAVLRGAATLETPHGTRRLTSNQQTIVAQGGFLGPITPAVRQLIQNGSFADGLSGWEHFQQQSPEEAGVVASGASVELGIDSIDAAEQAVVTLLRESARDDLAQAGIRQRIGKTLRVYSSLLLEFDAKISDQRPPGGGEDGTAFPLMIRLVYVDVEGQEREWTHGYYINDDPQHPVPNDRATRVDSDRWQHTIIDLRSLSPLPRQITTIVVYASGSSYQTRIANISLTSSELLETGP